MNLLYKCYIEKRKVCVHVRFHSYHYLGSRVGNGGISSCSSSSSRNYDNDVDYQAGTIEGYIKAFDKHYNIVLSDCIERKNIVVGIEWSPRQEDIDAAIRNAGGNKNVLLTAKGSRRLIKKYLYKKSEKHFHQLMLRGDNIMLVSVATN